LFANGLPNVQDEAYRRYLDLPNMQDEAYRDLPNVQDEAYQPEYCPFVVFGQNINAPHAGTCVQAHQALLPDLVHFSQYPVIQSLHTLSRRISRCWLLSADHLVPLLRLLVNFISSVYAVFEHAYVSPENQRRAAVLVHIELLRFFRHHPLSLHILCSPNWHTNKPTA
jgi:hypothetical protein